MPYKVTRRNGATDVLGDAFFNHVEWAHLSDEEWAVTGIEWVEPQTETRWRCTWDKGETTLQDTPPQDTFWQEAAYRDCLMKCERVEVEV